MRQHKSKHGTLIGRSPWAVDTRAEIRRAAACDSNSLIVGPNGTGKELIARAIHACSSRCDEPFVPVDCAGVTDSLFTSQMFGHTVGATTGASHAQPGYFRAANQGTIFLDEIGELSVGLQAKLLRVLQERMVAAVGGHKKTPVDVRILAATARDLGNDVQTGRFRADLYHRLNVITLQTLPLKDHPEDIEMLAAHLLAHMALEQRVPCKRLSSDALAEMIRYDWPGNVRELESVLDEASLFCDTDVICAEALAQAIPIEAHPGCDRTVRELGLATAGGTPFSTDMPAHWPTMDDLEQDHIQRTLELTNYNQCAAARLLGMDRHRLMRKAQKYGLDLSGSKRGRPESHVQPSIHGPDGPGHG